MGQSGHRAFEQSPLLVDQAWVGERPLAVMFHEPDYGRMGSGLQAGIRPFKVDGSDDTVILDHAWLQFVKPVLEFLSREPVGARLSRVCPPVPDLSTDTGNRCGFPSRLGTVGPPWTN